MVVKVQHFKDNFVGSYTEEIYANVENVFKTRDINDDIFIELQIKGQEINLIIPVTHSDNESNHVSLVGGIWLMNNEGKTIERLI